MFKNYSCESALKIIEAGFDDKRAPLEIIQEIITQFKEQLSSLGILKRMGLKLDTEEKVTGTFEEAEEIGNRILNRQKRAKNGNR